MDLTSIGGILTILCVSVWVAIKLILRLLNRKNELRQERLTVRNIGLSAEQAIRFCALARAKGITQKRLWQLAALEYLEKHTE